jgi:hypothetical protein
MGSRLVCPGLIVTEALGSDLAFNVVREGLEPAISPLRINMLLRVTTESPLDSLLGNRFGTEFGTGPL